MKNKNGIIVDCIQTNAGCIKWDGPNIPCLDIETGDMLDELVFAIVAKICANGTNDDIADIDLTCVIERLDINEPAEKTIASLLQLAFTNDCTLYDLIQDVRNLITNDVPLVLDLKCLSIKDSNGNELPYDETTVLQRLINSFCILQGQIASIVTSIAAINLRIDNLPAPYTEPLLATCFSGVTKTLSQTVQLIAIDYCAYRNKIGLSGAIDSAIGEQPTIVDVTDPLYANINLITPVTSLANSESNQWVFISSLLGRIQTLEDCACKFKCSDINIQFLPVDQEDGKQLVLNFSGDYGNFIPDGFDVGPDSKIYFIDKNKSQKSYIIPVGNIDTLNTEWESPIYDISMLDLTAPITIKVCVNLTNVTTNQVCCKCEEVEHMFVGSCSTCEVEASGPVTIIIKNINDKIQGIALQAGDLYTIPNGSSIISIDNIDNLTEIPPCLDVTTIEGTQCYIAAIGSFQIDGVGDTAFWEGANNTGVPLTTQGVGTEILGLEIESLPVLLATSFRPDIGSAWGTFDMNVLAPQIKALNGLIIDANGSFSNETVAGSVGVSLNYLQIKTLPSMINKIRVMMRSTADASLPGTARAVNSTIGFIPYADAVTAGYGNLPTSLCPPLT